MIHDLVTDHFRLLDIQKRALKRFKIETVKDLLYHFPTRYENSGDQKTVEGLVTGEDAILFGTLKSPKTRRAWKSKRPMSEAWLEDGTGKVKLMWFNQPYIAKMYTDGVMVKISGRVEGKTSKYVANPEVEIVSELPVGGVDTVFGAGEGTEELYAIYPETKGITSRWFRHAIAKVFKQKQIFDELTEVLPQNVQTTYKLPSLKTALLYIHQPKEIKHATVARKRFSFEEIFLIQVAKMQLRRELDLEESYTISESKIHAQEFIQTLPYTLTKGQQKAVDSILEDIGTPHAMSRLLEGDVGSGKTAVAAAATYAVVKTAPKERPSATLQVAYMAPTEILAEQHFKSFIEYFSHLPIQIGLITSSGCKKFPSKVRGGEATKISKSQLLKWVENGEIAVLIGTHSLIQKTVQFRDLGLVIIDEQHRFGVNQRALLVDRGTTRKETQINADTTNKQQDRPKLLYKDLTYTIRNVLMSVYNELGPGHKEIVYQKALSIEFEKRNIPFESEKQIDVHYRNKKVGVYQPDFIIDTKVIVETKALSYIGPKEKKQLWSYIKGSSYKVALLANFGTEKLQIERVVYDTARSNNDVSATSASNLRESAKVRLPHLLSMTATPIPRTLALTIYGDLDLTVLDEMPPGRKQIITEVVGRTGREKMYTHVRSQLDEGRQAYVICPRIEEPDPSKIAALQTKSVLAEAEKLKRNDLKEYRIEVLHGQMKPKEKEEIMEKLLRHEIDVLVATSVVEVGVNVPNATVIIIEGAERFGLAQLHQLRGRVVRSTHQAYCFALTSSGGSNRRLQAFVKAKNGFELAEQDLKIRGPGELYGRSQSGLTDLGMDALKNIKMVETARKEAHNMIEGDPLLRKHPKIKEAIQTKKEKIHFE